MRNQKGPGVGRKPTQRKKLGWIAHGKSGRRKDEGLPKNTWERYLEKKTNALIRRNPRGLEKPRDYGSKIHEGRRK